ncbi:MAG: hypothetical protein GF375_03725 [Candidatus Omnitrophica bacterium]|nr:hypothetical protein [Candidatus Omnitrophota bacterium]MBD3269170.1 hypothetical protein [Candidatus Omnitrophota bacterium]
MSRFILFFSFLAFSFGYTGESFKVALHDTGDEPASYAVSYQDNDSFYSSSGSSSGDDLTGELFVSKKGGFSFRIPPGWLSLPEKAIDTYIKVKLDEGDYINKYSQIENNLQGRRATYRMTEAAFQRKGSPEFLPPIVWLAVNNNKRVEKVEIRQFVTSVEASNAARIDYDEKRKIIHLVYPPYSAGPQGNMVTESIVILSRHGTVNFILISPLRNYYSNSEDLNFFVKHFKFRKGYEYGSLQRETGMIESKEDRWYNNKGLILVLLIMIMSVIFLFLRKKYIYYCF